ncbi:MAG: hypothetical protein QME74_01285, partial [Candidatus Edwardsbacteria bacterium]|nr:hypothetical protein [Candidatus Edwardsbacteria bacterium]
MVTTISRATCFSQEAGTELDYMSLGAGARPAGLGDAFSSLADDANAVYWNPAGLVQVKSPEVTWMHSDMNFGTAFDYVSAGTPLVIPGLKGREAKTKNYVGFGWIRTSAGDILITGIATDTIPGTNYNRVAIQGLAGFLSNAYMAAYAREVTGHISAGFTVKYYDIQVASHWARGFGMDAGLLLR